LTFDLIFLSIAVLLLAQTDPAQPTLPQQSQSATIQEPTLKNANANQSGWLVVAGIAGIAGCVGFVTLRHKHQVALKTNKNLQEGAPEEDTYFG